MHDHDKKEHFGYIRIPLRIIPKRLHHVERFHMLLISRFLFKQSKSHRSLQTYYQRSPTFSFSSAADDFDVVCEFSVSERFSSMSSISSSLCASRAQSNNRSLNNADVPERTSSFCRCSITDFSFSPQTKLYVSTIMNSFRDNIQPKIHIAKLLMFVANKAYKRQIFFLGCKVMWVVNLFSSTPPFQEKKE